MGTSHINAYDPKTQFSIWSFYSREHVKLIDVCQYIPVINNDLSAPHKLDQMEGKLNIAGQRLGNNHFRQKHDIDSGINHRLNSSPVLQI
jgi:hypothetical protein